MSESRGGGIVGWVFVLIAVSVLGYLWFAPDSKPEEKPAAADKRPSREVREYIANAQRLLEEGQFAEARKVAKTAIALEGSGTKPLLIAAEASAELEDLDAALEFYNKVPRDKSAASLSAGYGIASVQFFAGTFASAEEALRDLLKRRPSHAAGNDRLAELLDVEGRRWESIQYAIESIRQGRGTLETLVLLSDQNYIIRNTKRAAGAAERDPDDVGPLLGLARADLDNGRKDRGLAAVQKVLAKRPELLDAQMVWGEHLLDDSPEKFAKWHTSLPKNADDHPGLWNLRGAWSRRNQLPEHAARCYWEALKRQPNDQTAHLQLGQLLNALKRPDDAKKFLDRSQRLSSLSKVLEPVYSAGSDATPDELMDVAVAMEAVGRELEAKNWEREANSVAGTRFRFDVTGSPVRSMRHALSLWVQADSQPGLFVDLSDYPLPEISGAEEPNSISPRSTYLTRFEDQSAAVGLQFTFMPAPDDATEGKRIIELTGGGVAAMDYDLDGWPDMFFTQGGLYPRVDRSDSTFEPIDVLFRNLGSKFLSVSELAGVGSAEFGQGMAVADFNADGFPDLAVGNLGSNLLYENNGDGTFTNITTSLGEQPEDWSTSLAFTDLNGDALPDLYVANYLAGERIAEKICQLNEESLPRICTPDQFEAVQDRIYLNRGDGRFRDATETIGIKLPNGKGLGLLAADFLKRGSLQLFVANDGVENFFFEPKQNAEPLQFDETASLLGVHVSGEARAQACMGVAAGDANADGFLDFFVTNFDRESNTLYLGSDLGSFEDASRRTKLRDPSFRLLGFGTQFIDGDLDGNPDILLTNGHVDDFSHQGTAYRMRPQYFRNGGGAFAELFENDLGPFFAKEQLGRGLCRIDWNRDGREDAVISHLDTPAALLTNVSDKTGHSLTVRLVGTTGDRDAVGAVVTVSDGDWRRVRQRVAGDGYMCSNESILVFGLGERTSVPRLEVRWLDGSTQSFDNLAADQRITIVQNRDDYLQSVE